MARVRTVAGGLAALALAQVIVASQLAINQRITHALSHVVSAWERVERAVHPAPAPPVPQTPSEPAPRPRWTWGTPFGPPANLPAVATSRELYTSTRDALVALAADGRERWRVAAADAPILAEPILTTRGDVAAPVLGGIVVHDRDGRPRWTYTARAPESAAVASLTPTRDGGLAFVVERTGALGGPAELVAVDADGRTRWTLDLGAHRVLTLVPVADDLLVEIDGGLLRLAHDGTRVPTRLDGHPSRAPDGAVHVVDATSLIVLAPDGAVRATVSLGDASAACNDSGSAVASDGTIAFACGMRVYVVGAGALRWTATVGTRVASPPAFGPDGTLYVGADGVHAFDTVGRRQWHAPTIFAWRGAAPARAEPAAVTAGPLIGPDGTIYAGTERNRVHALRPDGAPRWVLPLGDDDGLVWRVGRLAFLDDALLIASHGLVAVPVDGARRSGTEHGT